MTLQELQEQALRLSVGDRQQLIDILQRSLQTQKHPEVKPKGLSANLIGIAKTEAPPPTDEEVKVILDERLAQKYL